MPFAPFSRRRLDELIQKFALPEAGRVYLEAALKAPSRNVKGTTRSGTEHTPCPKMLNALIQAESLTVENVAKFDKIFDHDVIGYLDQAPPIELIYVGRNDRKVRTVTTADYLVMSDVDGFVSEEWKSGDDRQKIIERYPGRYSQDEAGRIVSLPAIEAFARIGFKYVVRFGDEIPATRHLNHKFLWTYLEPGAGELYRSKLGLIEDVLRHSAFIRYEELIKEHQLEADWINWAIANGYVTIDWDQTQMSQPREVVVYRDDMTRRAYTLVGEVEGKYPGRARFSRDDVRIGDQFQFDGVLFTVEVVGVTSLHAVSERGEYFDRHWPRVEQDHLSGAITWMAQSTEPSADQIALRSASPERIADALEKLQIVEKINAGLPLGPTEIYSPRTFRKWAKEAALADANGQHAFIALLDRYDRSGFHGPHIDAALSKAIDDEITAELSNPSQPSTASSFSTVGLRIEALGYKMIARSSFYERVNRLRTLSNIRDSRGQKVAHSVEPLYWLLERDRPTHCERPFENVHIDHTLLPLEQISSVTGQTLSRAWLSAGIDDHARKPLGFFLSFFPPSYVSVMMVLIDIIRRYAHVPDAIVVDWGPEFNAKDLHSFCRAVRTRLWHRPKSCPKFGHVFERTYGITQSQVIYNLVGNTKATRNVRTMTRQVDPDELAGLTLSDSYFGLDKYFREILSTTPISSFFRSPDERMASARMSDGTRLHRRKTVEEILPVALPTSRHGLHTISSRTGLFANYEYYGNPRLTDMSLDGTKVPVKIHPMDPSLILAYVDREWIECRSKWAKELDGVSEFDRRAAFEELAAENRIMTLKKAMSALKTADLIERMNQQALDNKEFFKSRETKAFAITHGLSVASVDEASVRNDLENDERKVKFAAALASVIERGDYGRMA